MNLHILKHRSSHLLLGMLLTLVANSLAQTSDIVCPGSWKQVSSSGPAPRAGGHNLAFEPLGTRRHVLLFGGADPNSNRMGDTWTWDGTVWIHAADAGPSPRSGAALAYDFGQSRMVLFGGVGTPGDRYKDNQDTWKWNGTKWTEVAAGGGPPARNSHGMAYDGVRKKVVLFGGGVTFVGSIFNDTWEWDGTAWSQRSPASAPSPRSQFGMVYDGAHARTVLFGGHFCCDPKDFGDTWTWDGTVWTKVADTGPEARHDAGMSYDSARHRTVLFGGANVAGTDLGDTWEWDGAQWTRVATTGPAPRDGIPMAYDKARGKVVLFAGEEHGVIQQDTWEWRGPIYGCSNRTAGDLNCDHLVNHQDLTIVDAALGLPACSAADPRDLNQDGKINAQDAQLVANKCTKLGCK